MTDLGTFAGTPTSFGRAFAVNEAGHVAGDADSGSFSRAFLWIDGELIPIGPNLSYAYALNDLDHVVGQFTVRSRSRAFLYRDGKFVDLNTLIPSNPRITLTEARGINNAGWIVANGTNAKGQKRAFVLIPQ
jgi:probable HAF family extracellular repeat protein